MMRLNRPRKNSKIAGKSSPRGFQRGCVRTLFVNLVPQGRLSVAQHAVLGRRNQHDPVPAGTAENHPRMRSGVSKSRKPRTVVVLSVVPTGLFDLHRADPGLPSWATLNRPCGTESELGRKYVP